MATSFPAPYFKAPLNQPDAAAGRNLLSPVAQSAVMIRPKIGGRVKHRRRRTQKKGGFLPSVGESFAALAGKYVAPIALLGLYRLINQTRRTRRTRPKLRRA